MRLSEVGGRGGWAEGGGGTLPHTTTRHHPTSTTQINGPIAALK